MLTMFHRASRSDKSGRRKLQNTEENLNETGNKSREKRKSAAGKSVSLFLFPIFCFGRTLQVVKSDKRARVKPQLPTEWQCTIINIESEREREREKGDGGTERELKIGSKKKTREFRGEAPRNREYGMGKSPGRDTDTSSRRRCSANVTAARHNARRAVEKGPAD